MPTTFDLTTGAGRVAFDAYLRDRPGYGPDPPFARFVAAKHTGPKRRIEAGKVDLLVPKTCADEVLEHRRSMGIPTTRAARRVARRWAR